MIDGPKTVQSNPSRPSVSAAVRVHPRTILAALVALCVALGVALSGVNASAATVTIAPGASSGSEFGTAFLDGSAGATYVVPSNLKTGVYVGVAVRTTNATDGYRARVRIGADGVLSTAISRGETVLSSKAAAGKALAGKSVRVETKVSGTNPVKLSVRAWVVGEPINAWHDVDDTASNRVTVSGKPRTWLYLSATAPAAVSISSNSLTSAATVTTTPAPAPTTPAPAPTQPVTAVKPSADNTGVPAGTKLTRHDGNITVTQDGTVINGLDIHGFLSIKANNVKVVNSIIRGGKETYGNNQGLVSNFGYDNFVIEDSEIKAEFPSMWFIGMRGWNFTARRIHIVGNVDNIMIHGDNVNIEKSLLEDTDWYPSHPMQNDGPTHSDNVQILQGNKIRIVGNTIRGAQNFPILGSSSTANIPDLYIDGNYLDGGWCTLKLQTRNGYSLAATVKNNKFGPNRHEKHCVFLAPPEVKLTASGNVFEETGLAVPILRVAG